MTTAMYAFSGDPITFGHIDIIERATRVFDKVIVAIGNNSKKNYTFNLEFRESLAKEALKNYQNVEVTSFQGLLVDFAYERGVSVIIRGIRNFKDVDYENELFYVNMSQNKNIDTFFIPASQNKVHISSSAVKELQRETGFVHEYVPICVKKQLEHILSNQIIVGITGNIASGKSYVAEKFVEWGKDKHENIYNIDLDALGHKLFLEDSGLAIYVRGKLIETFGDKIIKNQLPKISIEIDRYILGEIVFGDLTKLEQLNKIMFEPILSLLRKEIHSKGKGIILINAALLVEAKLMHLCNNNIILITSSESDQYKRLQTRGLSDEQIKRRLSSQLTNDQKLEKLSQQIRANNIGNIWTFNNNNSNDMYNFYANVMYGLKKDYER